LRVGHCRFSDSLYLARAKTSDQFQRGEIHKGDEWRGSGGRGGWCSCTHFSTVRANHYYYYSASEAATAARTWSVRTITPWLSSASIYIYLFIHRATYNIGFSPTHSDDGPRGSGTCANDGVHIRSFRRISSRRRRRPIFPRQITDVPAATRSCSFQKSSWSTDCRTKHRQLTKINRDDAINLTASWRPILQRPNLFSVQKCGDFFVCSYTLLRIYTIHRLLSAVLNTVEKKSISNFHWNEIIIHYRIIGL